MPREPNFFELGRQADKIQVRLSYRIIELFSEGLYSSASKAIEELVSNSFDAGATSVHVLLPPDLGSPSANVVIIDDGVGMDKSGLKAHWLIGVSRKRDARRRPPKGRAQIGKFGIGKLATYVLAERLTHITKCDGNYYSTSIDYTEIPKSTDGIHTEKQVSLPLRILTEAQAKAAVAPWLISARPKGADWKMFGPGAAKSWTVAVMSQLRDMATEIQRGRLRYVLATGMPLRDDFKLFINSDQVFPSKLSAKRIKRWEIGKSLTKLPKPAPDESEFEITENEEVSKESLHRLGMTHCQLGRITGYVEIYEDLLTGGKSEEVGGRSHGFFVYVRERLVNIDDEYFGIEKNLLRHGTFARFRAVIHIDKLDIELRSSREGVREGALFNLAREVLKGIFNYARAELVDHDEGKQPGYQTARRAADSPASLTRRPLLHLVGSALQGKCSPKYTSYPLNLDQREQDEFIEELETKARSSEGFVSGVKLTDLSQEQGIAVLDIETGILQINTLHPFVAYFLDEYEDKKRSLPLELLALSEVLLEAHFYGINLDDAVVYDIMSQRDQLLRHLAKSSGKRSARLVSQALEESIADKSKLELELVAAFDSMGFSALPLGGKGKPDGKADAHLPPKNGHVERYSVSLEAKSKEHGSSTVRNEDVRVSTIERHRDQFGCDHALVVGPNFATTKGDTSLIVEIKDAAKKSPGKTITLVRAVDLAKLVRLVPLKRINLAKLREFFRNCITPEESKAWIEKIAEEKRERPKFREVLEAIADEQKEQPGAPVEYAAIVVALRKGKANLRMDKEEVKDWCRALGRLAPEFVISLDSAVELNQRPDKVLDAISAAISDYPEDER